MKVGEGRNKKLGILEYRRNLGCIFDNLGASRLLLFSMDGLIMMLSWKCYRSHLKVKKVFLNVQNIRTNNFNLVKSLRNTCE